MLGFKEKELTEEEIEYNEITALGSGVGGYGLHIPKDKTFYDTGWCCPKCDRVYSPKVKQCKKCNEVIFETD